MKLPASPLLSIDNFEGGAGLSGWSNLDVQNETDPFVDNPQVSIIEAEADAQAGADNHYMLRKPAPEGVIGNRKAIGFKPLPLAVDVGKTYTFYTRVNVESFPNNHSFGLSNLAAADIPEAHYNAFEPMIRITDKAESNGDKNDGTLMVLSGDNKAYSKINNPASGMSAKPLISGVWYELWYVVNNSARVSGGQRYDLYVRGGEFETQQLVFQDADFRMRREQSLKAFMAISNTGPHRQPYGNGGVRYDDIYMTEGRVLTTPVTQ